MVFKANIPNPNDNLSDSQGDLLGNMQQLDNTYGVDHYKFSDPTANNGFHNTVTTPLIVGGTDPTTPVGINKLYSINAGNIGLIQTSRGQNNASPSPITNLMSPQTFIVLGTESTINILDFTGLNLVIATLMLVNQGGPTLIFRADLMWGGGGGSITNVSNSQPAINLTVAFAGNILQVTNNSGTPLSIVFWSLKLYRVN